MADTVDKLYLFPAGFTEGTDTMGKYQRKIVVHFTNESDGTGESAVQKIDKSDLLGPDEAAPTTLVVEKIEYSVWGMNYVTVEWNHTTPDEIAVLRGQGYIDWTETGGKNDPASTGGTGDIQFTTDGAVDGSGYDITLWVRLKA